MRHSPRQLFRYLVGNLWLTVVSSIGFSSLPGSGNAAPAGWEAPKPFEDEIPRVVWTLAYNPDGKNLAYSGIGEKGGLVTLWDPATRAKKATFLGGKRSIRSLAYSPDGKVIAAGDEVGQVWLWEVETGKIVTSLQCGYFVRSMTYSPDGKLIAVADSGTAKESDGTLTLWDTTTGKKAAALEGPLDALSAVAFSPDGKLLVACGTADNRSMTPLVALWDVASGKRKWTECFDEVWLNGVAFTNDGKSVITAGNDRNPDKKGITSGTLRILTADTGKHRQFQKLENYYLLSMAMSRDGKTVAMSGYGSLKDIKGEGRLNLYSLANERVETTLECPESLHAVAFSPDGQRLVGIANSTQTVKSITLFTWESSNSK